ncbi:MAG: GNAT family N-acetyltransferase [Gammaproteobacteria bacterium]|nr:GNAT family N-acetyltransferase [Gammaproteobacteria bacterium]
MEIKILNSLCQISPESWQTLTGKLYPFTRYEFLNGLEQCGCVGEALGWIPAHFVIEEKGKLVAAMPAYIKTNSYGELVFDWAWAEAYQRSGMAYYPKLVCAIPYTPATGPRLLVAPGRDVVRYRSALLEAMHAFVQQQSLSGFHCLFPHDTEHAVLQAQGMLLRQACQFHWRNNGYENFENFLAEFSSRKRKKVLRERRRVQEAGIDIEILHGDMLNHSHWQQLYPFYRDTFLDKGGVPTLTQTFFEEISRSMGEQLIVVAARQDKNYVAAAIFFKSNDTLYGRHWGCHQQFSGLHFELCYYQGIEYAIANKLARFEPGAQGEYKISRGFYPTSVWSAHWLEDVGFRRVVSDFLDRERAYMREYCEALEEELPFKKDNVE